jgi:hypothetical protein
MSWPCFVCWGEYHGSGYCQNYPACRRSQVQRSSEALAIGSLTWHQPPGTPPPASAALVAHPAVVVQPAACSAAAQAAISAGVPALVTGPAQGSTTAGGSVTDFVVEPKKRPRQLSTSSKSASKAKASRSSPATSSLQIISRPKQPMVMTGRRADAMSQVMSLAQYLVYEGAASSSTAGPAAFHQPFLSSSSDSPRSDISSR